MILGWISKLELYYISKWATKIPSDGIIVELGSFMGKSSVCWASHADPTVTIYCIDSFVEEYKPTNLISSNSDPTNPNIPHNGKTYNVFKSFIENTKQYKNIIPLRGILPNDITYENSKIDLLFIDLAHVNPIDWDSIMLFLPHMKDNSIICGHDYSDNFPDVKENAKRLAEMFNSKVESFTNTSLWSVRITK